GKLPQPSDVTGAFQNVPFRDPLPLGPEPQEVKKLPTFYEDAAIIAYRQPVADIPFRELKPKITSSGGQFDINALTDGDLAKTSNRPPTEIGENAWIQFASDKPQTFKALTIVAGEPAMQFAPAASNRALQASDDGVNFREVLPIPVSTVPQNTIS